MAQLALPEETERTLAQNFFDADSFERLRERLLAGTASDANSLDGVITRIEQDSIPRLGSLDEQTRTLGSSLLQANKVGCVILAGGMATRFGGVVKAAVEVDNGKNFLTLKIDQLKRLAHSLGARIPVYLMTSFATDETIRALAKTQASDQVPIRCFRQFVSVRLNEDGTPFLTDQGEASLYAPGHGDLTFALRREGLLEAFRQSGGEHLLMSNVDNLAASLDPVLVGLHASSGADITVEVVSKDPGDKGGAPANVDGVPQVVEGFRFPETFDQDTIPVFNTNTFLMRAEAIDRDFELDWFLVKKQVDGRKVIQFERLVGQVTAFAKTHFVHVPRHGKESRFLPVKDPQELDERLSQIRQVVARG